MRDPFAPPRIWPNPSGRGGLKVVVLGGGPAEAALRPPDEEGEPGSPDHGSRAQSPGRHLRMRVFSDQTLGNFRLADPETYEEISANFARWDDIDIHFKGRTITSGGMASRASRESKLLEILQHRAAGLGADLRFHCEVRDEAEHPALGLADADLILAADGVNSAIRRKYADRFRPTWSAAGRSTSARHHRRSSRPSPSSSSRTRPGSSRSTPIRSATAFRPSSSSATRLPGATPVSTAWTSTPPSPPARRCSAWLDGHRLLANVAPQQRAAPG